MLKIRFIVVDRTRSPFLKKGEVFYLERLRRYARVEWIEVKPAKITKGRPDGEIKAEEAENITKRLGPRDYPIVLDRTGHQFSSGELASWVEKLSIHVGGWVCFIIGGPLGLSDNILSHARKTWSLSRLTLTHEMSRLLLLEQTYRAFTILKGEKYHK